MNVTMTKAGRTHHDSARELFGPLKNFKWALPGIFLLAVVLLSSGFAPWIRMWTIAFGVYFMCKAWVMMVARRNGYQFTTVRRLQFLILWAGMRPEPFCEMNNTEQVGACIPTKPAPVMEGVVKLVMGLVLFALATMVQEQLGTLTAVWVGISAYCLVLHFGVLHLFAAYWQRRGVPVELIMQRPAQSTSLNDFWARRWNRAFRDVCHTLIIRPTRRVLGPTGGLGLVFVASGLVHELIMSVPAGGGFGGPFAYFSLQIPGCWLERRNSIRHVIRKHVWLGRVWTAAWVVVPLPLLVNKTFVDIVLVPFFLALGVIS